MNTILTMNFTGTVLLLLYYALKTFWGDRVTKKSLYFLLRIDAICFLVPLVLIGEIYKSIWMDIKLLMGIPVLKPFCLTPGDFTILNVDGKMKPSRGLKLEIAVFLAVALIAVLRMVCWTVQEHRYKAAVHRAIRISGIGLNPMVEELRIQYGVRRNVAVCVCRDMSQIATVGLFRPIIFFRESAEEKEKALVLEHEIFHVKRLDIFWKWITRLICCIHFYNPASYLLSRELDAMREMSCDEWMTREMDDVEKAYYTRLVVDYSCNLVEGQQYDSVAFFSGRSGYSEIQERMDEIMKNGKEKWSKLTVGIVVGIIFWATSLTTLAYHDVKWWSADDGSVNYLINGGSKDSWVYVMPNSSVDDVSDYDIPILYDREYVDSQGNVYPLDETAPRVICFIHSYVDCKIVEHYVDDRGGCQTYFYDAKICEKCQKVTNKILKNVVPYSVCPHN